MIIASAPKSKALRNNIFGVNNAFTLAAGMQRLIH